MASQRLSAELSFLTDAAHLLRQTAPETSAHLMRQRAELMYHNGLAQQETQSQHVCGACGHIMIPGQKTALKLHGSPRPRAGKRTGLKRSSMATAPPKGGPTKSIMCGLCRQITRISLPPPEAVRRRKRPQALAISSSSSSSSNKMTNVAVSGLHAQKPTATTANASSKKRAKNRKGGLQALLAGQQHKSSSSLSLADFMG
ncbi:hypothetical protein E4U55_005348 [Claviceps digitariae]|nr:hypothetical protein E4U55_005348 [Claviceps digitariae]